MTSSRNSTKQTSQEYDQSNLVEEKIIKTNGDITIRKYQKGRFLGKGGFARVYEFVNIETNKVSAAKVVAKSSLTKSRAKQKLMSEIKIHRSLHNNHVVDFEHFFEDAENVYILLELCTNQTMNEMLRRRKRLTEIEVQCYMVQCISALKYLHQHRVIHRDLKLGNLFLNEKMEIKIGDFGLATKLEFEGEKKRTICGTPNYIAPEILEGKQGHSYEVDIWSLGVIIYTLIIGKPPFETSDVKTTYRRIRMNAYTFPEHVAISEAGKGLITRILNGDPSRRPSLDDILQHEFFHQGWMIPKVLPSSTLACPPPSSFLRQYMPQNQALQKQGSLRLADTAPGIQVQNQSTKGQQEFHNTERLSLRKQIKPNTPQGDRNSDNQFGKISPRSDLKSSSNRNQESKSSRPTVKQAAISNTVQNGDKQEIWVKKWVDYSSKYGLGYLLSNGVTGVFFNDSSKIILDPNGINFDYIERRSSDRQDIIISKTLNDYPKELQKKVTLLQHFRSYLEGENKIEQTEEKEATQQSREPLMYVKKWMRTKHAIMFRLSNKIVQVNFQDHTEIILSSENKQVTYVNKRGERQTYPLTSALESSNAEMSKRLKYTKDILTHMLSTGAYQPGTGNSQFRRLGIDTKQDIGKGKQEVLMILTFICILLFVISTAFL